MKQPLNDNQLDEVTGGAVVLSGPLGVCGFNTTGQVFKIKADVKVMRNRLIQLYDENENMSDAEFDQLVMNEFKSRGWI